MNDHRATSSQTSRRQWLTSAAGATAASGLGVTTVSALESPQDAALQAAAASRWRYCLNTATIRGQKLSLDRQVGVAIQAGYDGLEPWIQDVQAYAEQGGDLRDLRRRMQDAGLRVESAIGFAPWIVADSAERARGLEQARRDMDLLRRLGGGRIAAPPAGATRDQLPLEDVARRYRELLRIGADIGVVPQLELWGFSLTLSRLGELAYVAAEAGRADACVLPDVYHIYKGGSEFAGLHLLAGKAMHVFHVNDYPLDPPRASIADADRVFPGDGAAPLTAIYQLLDGNGFCGALSLELFNPDYWKMDPLEAARLGLQKMQAGVRRAFTSELDQG